MYTMRSDASPKCASVPRPPFSPVPSTPKPCASSTTSQASNSSASAHRAGSGARSPSMLNTASVAISLRFAVDAASRRRSAATSACG